MLNFQKLSATFILVLVAAGCAPQESDGVGQSFAMPSPDEIHAELVKDPRAQPLIAKLTGKGCVITGSHATILPATSSDPTYYRENVQCGEDDFGGGLSAMIGPRGEILAIRGVYYQPGPHGVPIGKQLSVNDNGIVEERVMDKNFQHDLTVKLAFTQLVFMQDMEDRGLLGSLEDDDWGSPGVGRTRESQTAPTVGAARYASQVCTECGSHFASPGLIDGAPDCANSCCGCQSAHSACAVLQTNNGKGGIWSSDGFTNAAASSTVAWIGTCALALVAIGASVDLILAAALPGATAGTVITPTVAAAAQSGQTEISLANIVKWGLQNASNHPKVVQALQNAKPVLDLKIPGLGISVGGALTWIAFTRGPELVTSLYMSVMDYVRFYLDTTWNVGKQLGPQGYQAICYLLNRCSEAPNCTTSGKQFGYGPPKQACCVPDAEKCHTPGWTGTPSKCPGDITWKLNYNPIGCMCPGSVNGAPAPCVQTNQGADGPDGCLYECTKVTQHEVPMCNGVPFW